MKNKKNEVKLDATLIPKPLNIKKYKDAKANAKRKDDVIKENIIAPMKLAIGAKYFPNELPKDCRVMCRNFDYTTMGEWTLKSLDNGSIVTCVELVKLIKLSE